jgi:hypothetical protein
MDPEKEKRFRFRARYEAEQAALQQPSVEQPTPPQSALPQAQEQGLLGRSYDTLKTGASDAISTVMGDTYGRSGDPTQKDNLPLWHSMRSNRLVKAAGGDILPAIGEVGGDILLEAGKGILNDEQEQRIAKDAQRLMGSGLAQAAGRGVDVAKEALGPDKTALVGEVANIAGAVLPVPKITPKFPARFAARNKRALEKTLSNQKRNDLRSRFEPADPYDQGTLEIMDDTLKTKRFVPNERYEGVLDEVDKTPGVKSTNSHTENRRALENEVSKVRKTLDEKLDTANPVSGQALDDELLEAMVRAEDEFVLQGDAGKSAQKLYEEFNKMYTQKLDDAGNISARDLLAVRRELDNKIRDAVAGDPFSPGNTASKVATRELRQSINKLVVDAAPDAGVADDLARMNKMLEARDVILPSTKTEAKTGLGRSLERLEERTGLKHPVSPLALQSNISSPATVGLTGAAAALAMGGGRAVGNTLKKGSVAGDRIIAEMIEKGIPAAERAAILAALQEEENR